MLTTFETGIFANCARRLAACQVYVKSPWTLRMVSCVDTILTDKAGALQGAKQELRSFILRDGSAVDPGRVLVASTVADNAVQSKSSSRASASSIFSWRQDLPASPNMGSRKDQRAGAGRDEGAKARGGGSGKEAAAIDTTDRRLHDLVMAWCLSVDREYILTSGVTSTSSAPHDRAFLDGLCSAGGGGGEGKMGGGRQSGAGGRGSGPETMNGSVARTDLLLDMMRWQDRYELVCEVSFDPAHKYAVRVLAANAPRSRHSNGAGRALVLLITGAPDVLMPLCAVVPAGDGAGDGQSGKKGRRSKSSRSRGASTAPVYRGTDVLR
jgi:hypothetical protein